MRTILGYIISGVGLLFLFFSVGPIYSKLSFLQGIHSDYLMIIGVIFAIVGVALLSFNFSGKKREVPIYHGKRIVGYRVVGH